MAQNDWMKDRGTAAAPPESVDASGVCLVEETGRVAPVGEENRPRGRSGRSRAAKPAVSEQSRAQAVLEAELQVQAEQEAAAAARQAELEDLQRRAPGEVVAAGDDGDAVSRRLAQDVQALAFRVEAHLQEARQAEVRAAEARREVVRAEAADKRAEAAKLTAEADERQKRTDELLAALKEHEGADYMPWRLTESEAREQIREQGWCWAPHVPATAKLRSQAAGLVEEADALEASVTPVQSNLTATVIVRRTWRGSDMGAGPASIGVPDMVTASASFHASAGVGDPVECEFLVDGQLVGTCTVTPGAPSEVVGWELGRLAPGHQIEGVSLVARRVDGQVLVEQVVTEHLLERAPRKSAMHY